MRKILRLCQGLTIACLTTAPTFAIGLERIGEGSHVRFKNDRIEEVFRFVFDRSPTFRELLATIDASNVIVHIEEGPCRQGTLRSCLHLMPTPAARHVIVHLDSRQLRQSVAGQLAHELRHAVEIASDPSIVNTQSLRHFYERVGFQNCAPGTPECWETRAAQTVETLVVQEIVNGRGTTSRVAEAYFGTWTLNVERSTFENLATPKASRRVHGDRRFGLISIVTTTEDASGKQLDSAFVYRLDGKDYPMPVDDLQPRRTIMVTSIDRLTAEFVIKRGGQIISTGRRTLDASGSTMTIEAQRCDAEGHSTRSVAIWEKQKGSVTSQR